VSEIRNPKPEIRNLMSNQNKAVVVVSEDWSVKFAPVREYEQQARMHVVASAACMILSGVELLRLKDEFDISHGGDRRSDQAFTRESLKWVDLVKSQAGLSEASAWRRTEMALSAGEQVKEIRAWMESGKALVQLPVALQERIAKSVQAVTDGKSAHALMIEWGIAKESQPPALAGGLVATTEQLSKPRKPTAAEIAKAADQVIRERAGWVLGYAKDKQMRLAKTKSLQALLKAQTELGKEIEAILGQRKDAKGAKPAKKGAK
jgi:hypothetical protein